MANSAETTNSRLEPGDDAPDFALESDTGQTVRLSDLVGAGSAGGGSADGAGKVIVYFYPAAMTPGCTKQACDFTDSYDSLADAGYTVVGISPDKPDKLAKFRAEENLRITLLGDPSREVLRAWGAFGEKTMYGKVVEGVIRSTFVVDADRKVEVAQYNVKATGHVAKLRRDLGV